MSAAATKERISGASPSSIARIAGFFYVVNIVTGLYSFFGGRPRLAFACGLIGTACYIAVTILFYFLFRPVNRSLSLVAALFSFAGSAVGHVGFIHIHFLVFFGFYCLLIGYLILKSTFLPRFLGVLMMIAGLGWLTFVSPSLAGSLHPYNLWSGGIGEGLLTLWPVVWGVNAQHWDEQAAASAAGRQ